MCGRFNVIDDPTLRELLRALGIEEGLPTRVNIAPTEAVPIVVHGCRGPELRSMRWWLTPSWAPGVSTRYSMFNAKSETVASSRAFRGPFRRRRGIVPASSFIEWQGDGQGKQAWLIRPREGAFALAAIWDHWEGDGQVVESCALLTTAAAPGIARIHHRMPVVLAAGDAEEWLNPASELGELPRFFTAPLPVPVVAVPLGRRVNNARNKDLDVLLPQGQEVDISR